MTEPLRCWWCGKLLTRALGCPICGAYVCEDCWGPDGEICIHCYETGIDEDWDDEEDDC